LIVSGVPLVTNSAIEGPAAAVTRVAPVVAGSAPATTKATRTTPTSASAGTDTILVLVSARNANPVSTARAAVREAAAGISGVKAARQIGTDLVSVTLDAKVSAGVAEKLAKAVAARPGVEAADRSLTFTPADTSTVQDYQWNLRNAASYGVGAVDAWKTTTGLNASGKTVVVGVVDTGIASNAALPPTTQTKVTAVNGAKVVGTTAAGLTVVVRNAADQSVCDTVADSSGAFTCTPLNPKPSEDDVLTVTATDKLGRTSIAKWVVGDATAPDAPVINPSNGTTISGTAEPGATITLTYPDDSTQTATALADRTWSVDPSYPLDHGDKVTATATDANGNVSDATTTTIDQIAPEAPVLEPTQGTVVKGSKEADSFVTLTWTDADGTDHSLVLEASPATTWTAELTPAAKDGSTIGATATDRAGNVSDRGTVRADHTPPAVPTVDPSNGQTVSISGVENGATPKLVDESDAVVAGAWADDGSGKWTFTPSVALTEQDKVFVVLTDEAGNATDPVPVIVDTTAPDKPVVNPTNGWMLNGNAERGSTITITYMRHGTKVTITTTTAADGTFTTSVNPPASNGRTITVTATDAAGNTSAPATVIVDATPPSAPAVAPSNGHTVSISGVETGATPSLVDADDAEVAGHWADGGAGSWTFTPDNPLTEGADVQVVLTDDAGNTSVPVAVTVDTTAPDAPVIATITATEVAGTAEAGATVKVTYRDADDAEHTTDPLVADGGTWTLALDPAAKAGSAVRATASDAVGNTSPEATATVPDEPSPSPSPSGSSDPGPAADANRQQVVSAANVNAAPSSVSDTPDTTVDNGTNLVGAVLPGYDFLDGDADPTDASAGSHGTHVAGIVADSGLSGTPAGVAPAVQVEPLRAMNAGGGTMAAVIAAINWGAGTYGDNPYPVDVLNLSIETQDATSCPTSLQQAIDAAVAKGVVVVAAAGNYNASISTSAPANCKNVIVATASTASGDRASYSSWGTSATSAAWLVAAPGGSGDAASCTTTSCPSWILSRVGDNLVGKAGTSMAAPHVAAVAALLKAANPALTPDQIARIIRGTATTMHDGCPTAVCGSGIVNAAAAVAKASDAASVTAADGVGATVSVVVTGTRQVGAVLTAAPLAGANAYTTPSSYQWLRGDGVTDVPIPGETSSSYRITGADYGKYLSVRVTTTLGGATTTAGKASVWTAGYLSPLQKPTVTGKSYKVKKTLKASIGTWSPVTPSSVKYQWYRNDKKIKKATKATYKLTKSDRNKKVKVKVTVSATGYNTTYAYSASHKIKR
jgi:subtilisin family serine protease